MQEAYIYDALRTPRDSRSADNPYEEIKPVDLLVRALHALRARNDFDPGEVGDAIIGMVHPGEYYGVNMARAGLLKAGWPASVSGMALNRNGASSLSAINLAATKIRAGIDALVIAGGVDSRSRLHHSHNNSIPVSDPEWLAQTGYIPPALAADLMATIYGVSREDADAYALQSFQKAAEAVSRGYLKPSVIELSDRNGLPLLREDTPRWTDLNAETLAAFSPLNQDLKTPGFGDVALSKHPEVEQIALVHTPGNSAPWVDGAALLLLGNRETGAALGLKPRARILAMSHTCTEPTLMFRGALDAAQKCLQLSGLKKEAVDLWRCNEPYAAVPLIFQRSFGLKEEQFNLSGGAIAFGKAAGAGGAILTASMLCELEYQQARTGMIAVAAEGGIGVALLLERLP